MNNRWTAADLRKALQEMELSQVAFSRLTGTKLRTVAGWVNGERKIPTYMPFMIKCMKFFLTHGGS